MKHNISLRIYEPKKATIEINDKTMVSMASGDDEKSSNDDSGTRALRVLTQFWQRLSDQTRSEEETVIAAFSPNKRGLDGTAKFSLHISELGVSPDHVNRYMRLVLILRITIRHLRVGGVTTLRDIYYRDVGAFGGRQTRLNAALQLLCRSFQLLPVTDLGIVPSPKGLVWGGPHIDLQADSGVNLILNFSADYSVVPPLRANAELDALSAPQVIIVFEKEAVFKSFCNYTRQMRPEARIVALTGRGFPDTSTKQFLSALSTAFPLVPVLIFVDSDVYGLRIFWNYQEAARDAQLAGVFLFEHQEGWLGISSRERRILTKALQTNESRRYKKAAEDEEVPEEEQAEEEKEEQIEGSEVEVGQEKESDQVAPRSTTIALKPEASPIIASSKFPPYSYSRQLPCLQPLAQYGNLSIQHLNAERTHREITRALLVGVKAEMNVLSDRPRSQAPLHHYLWNRIHRALSCSTPPAGKYCTLPRTE